MPTYQYACTVCGHKLEVVQSFSDSPLTECPECQGNLRKVFSSVGIVFKGSGFYRTDSRSGSSSDTGSTTAKSDSGASGSGSTSSTGANGSSGSGTATTAASSGSAPAQKSATPAKSAAS